jgi:hypothetical protein
MRVPTGILPSLSPAAAIAAPDFGCVKVRAGIDLLLAALAPYSHGYAYGKPRDIMASVKGAAFPEDGRDMNRRAIVYKLEHDDWVTILREGDRFAGFDPVLAQGLSRALGTRAMTLFVDGAKKDLAYDIYEKGESVASFLHLEGTEAEGHVERALLTLDLGTHARRVLEREDATNDRLAFRHFELPGTLRGRWDLGFERALLIPELPPIDVATEERRAKATAKTRRLVNAAAADAENDRRLTREGERGVRDVLKSLIAETTGGL